MTITILDPTHEEDSKVFQMASGLKNLKGARIGFISNGKKGTYPFFNVLESLLKNEYEVGEVVRVVKKKLLGSCRFRNHEPGPKMGCRGHRSR